MLTAANESSSFIEIRLVSFPSGFVTTVVLLQDEDEDEEEDEDPLLLASENFVDASLFPLF